MIRSSLKKILSLLINIFLSFVIWTFLIHVLDFLGWAIDYKSLDFNHWWWHNMEEGSLSWGIFTFIVSFPFTFLIVKKVNIKL